MKEEEIARNLEELAREQAPGTQDLWPSIRTRLDIMVPPQAASSRVADTPRGGLRLAIVPAIIVALAMALLYVVLTNRAPNGSASLAPAESATLAPAKALSAVELLDHVEEAEAGTVTSFHGVFLSEHRDSAKGEFNHSRSERWYLAPNKLRYSDTYTGQSGESGKLIWVTNGVTAWTYDSTLRTNKARSAQPPAQVPFQVSVLTLRLGGSTKIQSFYNAKLLGTGSMIGRTVHIVELILKPSAERPPGQSVTGGHDRVKLWIDDATFFVLKSQNSDADGNILETSGYESFELNGPVDPAVFDISPPED